jgi:hypothetical protein
MIRKKITGWEKAIYYFSTINLNYDNIWFIEDDVFFYNENTLLNIDLKYPNADLLSKQYTVNINGNKKYWHWRSINIPFAPPYYSAMVCACRMSKKLLSKIKEYTNVHRTMFFLEAMFPTICKRTGLVYHTPEELNGIVWRKKYTATDLDVKGLFHPIKNKQQHTMYRNLIRLIS